MRARAEAAEQTRDAILRAGLDVSIRKMPMEITLDDVARGAGVSVQTVLRHFGSRDGLLDALMEYAQREIVAEWSALPTELDAALDAILRHYELRGDQLIRMLAQEHSDERVARITALARRTHREWVETVFAPRLRRMSAARRGELTDLLVVATDVSTWKLLRRDRGLDRPTVRQRVRRMVAALIEEDVPARV